MCRQVLFSGKVQCKDGDTGEIVAEIDYGPISKTVLAKFWWDPTSKPLDDLKAAQRLVSGACGFAANFIVMGRLAGDAFESNPSVLESYNKLHIQPGVLTAEFEQFGVVCLARGAGPALRFGGAVREHRRLDEILRPRKGGPGRVNRHPERMAYAGVAQASDEARE